MPAKPYSTYTIEEFTLDDLFVRWVKYPDDEEVAAYWTIWLSNNPDCAETVETARSLVRESSLSRNGPLSGDEVSSVWGRIRESLQTMDDVRPLQPDVRAMVGWWYFLRTSAAVFGLVGLIGWAVWMQYGPDQAVRTVSTRAGQSRTIYLPDNSIVKLYANSSVRYARQWSDESPRAVWLQGEADFDVVHRADTSSARLFRVHTNDLTIEAVGTTFRVYQQPQCTRVALRQGQINVLLEQQRPIRLLPGDSVDVTAGGVHSLP